MYCKSLAFLFTLLIFFNEKKFLILTKSKLSIFSFMASILSVCLLQGFSVYLKVMKMSFYGLL